MKPQEFKNWMNNTIRDARKQGLPDEDILFELLEQAKFIIVKKQIETMERRKQC